jgi:hypothetical protein
MTHIPVPARAGVPMSVGFAVATWLAAVGAGIGEVTVWLGLPDPPSPDQLIARFAIYAVVVGLVFALLTGRNTVRWVLAILLGVFGTLSLVFEPVLWLMAGGSPAAFLAAADGPTIAITTLRAAHIIAVLIALSLMFGRRSNAFFRTRKRVSQVPPGGDDALGSTHLDGTAHGRSTSCQSS